MIGVTRKNASNANSMSLDLERNYSNSINSVNSFLRKNISSKKLVLSEPARLVRRRIELLTRSTDLPLARKSIGMLEGDHSSRRRFGTGDVIDIHSWQPGDEARMMNWSASARTGQPMVSSRERSCASKTWILLDTSIQMKGACVSGESLYEAASNAALLIASLSIKRNDAVSLVGVDGKKVEQLKPSKSLADFEHEIDNLLLRSLHNSRNIDDLLSFALSIKNHNNLIVIVTDNYALSCKNNDKLRKIAQTHVLIVININALNPFDSSKQVDLIDGVTLRKVPAFLRDKNIMQEVENSDEIRFNNMQDLLSSIKATYICAESSEEILKKTVHLITKSTSYLNSEVQNTEGKSGVVA